MSELLDQINALETELQQVIDSSEHKFVITEYSSISDKLSKIENRLSNVVMQKEIITKLPSNFGIIAYSDDEEGKLNSANSCMDALIKEWQELDFEIAQKETLANTIKSIEEINSVVSFKYNRVWQEWIGELRAAFSISEALLETQKNIPHLAKVYSDYKKWSSQFEVLESSIPSDKSVIISLSDLSKELGKLLAEMDFDVPNDVRKLFDYLKSRYSNPTAPLDMITSEVMEWLVETGEINNFVVKRR